MVNRKFRIVSLFAGCGGLDLGFAWEDFNIIWANDNLKDACTSYEKNIDKNIVCKDIREVNLRSIPNAEIVIGGPPCQGFSGIGKRDPHDERSALAWSYIDILKHVKPKIFLFENVTGLRSAKASDGSSVVESLVKAFRRVGYKINVHVLNAADYGVPQMRKRVFIVGNNLGIEISPPPPTHSENGGSLKKWVSSYEAISDLGEPSDDGIVKYIKLPDCEFQRFIRKNSKSSTTLHITPYASKKDLEIMEHVKPGGNYNDVPDHVATQRILYFKRTGGRTTTYGRMDPKKPTYTLNTYFDRPNIGCNIHYRHNRMITIREGMRFQAFPDNFVIYSSNKRNYYAQVGNAVPPLLSKAWAAHINKILLHRK